MKVINREVCKNGVDQVTTYKMDTGHELNQWHSGIATACTPSGNYASQKTLLKLCRIVSEFESRRVQIPNC